MPDMQNIPEAVGESPDGMLTLSDRPIIATLVNAVKEIWGELVGYDDRFNELEQEVEELKLRVAELSPASTNSEHSDESKIVSDGGENAATTTQNSGTSSQAIADTITSSSTPAEIAPDNDNIETQVPETEPGAQNPVDVPEETAEISPTDETIDPDSLGEESFDATNDDILTIEEAA